MQSYNKRSFQNLEILRFILIWAVVGVHLPYLGLSQLGDYSWEVNWTSGWQAVEMFFLMSGFFLFYKVDVSETVLNFAKRKWLRLAPFIITLTLIGYLLTGFDISQYPLSVNIFNSLLLLDWNTHHFGPDATIIYVAWFANVLFFVSVIYFCIMKTFRQEQATFIIGLISFICFYMYNRHVFIIVPFIFPLVRAFSYMGFGFLLCQIWKSYNSNGKNNNDSVSIGISIIEAVLFITVIVGLFAGSSGVPAPEGLSVPPDQIAKLNAQTWFPELNRWAIGGVWLQLSFIALFWLFILNRGLVSRLLSNRISIILGSYSYAIFLVHTIIIRAVRDYCDLANFELAHNSPVAFITLTCAVITVFAILAHYFLEVPLNRLTNRLVKKH